MEVLKKYQLILISFSSNFFFEGRNGWKTNKIKEPLVSGNFYLFDVHQLHNSKINDRLLPVQLMWNWIVKSKNMTTSSSKNANKICNWSDC